MARFKRVLLVEDDPITTLICDCIIKTNGFAEELKSCVNGKFAIDYLKDVVEQHKASPDIILLDINMPVMNGWDFLEEFHAIEKCFDHLPRIFILSSSIDPADFKKAESFPTVDTFISKPLTNDFLNQIN